MQSGSEVGRRYRSAFHGIKSIVDDEGWSWVAATATPFILESVCVVDC
jgi:hypothetical protein